MATTDLTGALRRADRQGMTLAHRLAHEAGGYVRVTPEVHRAVVRYGICQDTLAELESKRIDSVPLFNELKNAQAGLAEAHAILAAAGQLHLVEVA